MTKEEFYEEMRQDAYLEEKQAYDQERRLENDLEYCIDFYAEDADAIHEAKMKLLFNLAKHGHDLSLKELEEWL